jgi:hypothetical protein
MCNDKSVSELSVQVGVVFLLLFHVIIFYLGYLIMMLMFFCYKTG